MQKIKGLTWEPIKTKGAIATNNEKLACALINWYFEHVNDYHPFKDMILDQTHIKQLEVFACVQEFSEDVEKIITLIHMDGGIMLRVA